MWPTACKTAIITPTLWIGDENSLTISIDNVKFHTFDISSNTYFHDNFYILFNLAVGGAFTGITDIHKLTGLKDGQKVKMYIDWVKIL